MKTNAGLWIDHREAIIVKLADTGMTTKHILSTAETQPRREGEPDFLTSSSIFAMAAEKSLLSPAQRAE